MRYLVLFMLAATGLLAADATGRWTGKLILSSSDGGEQSHAAVLVLKQDGAVLTGTAGPDEDQQPIQNGKVENGVLTFELNRDGGVMKFNLKQEADEMTGDVTRERDGQTQRARLAMKR